MFTKWAAVLVVVAGCACALAQQPVRKAIDPNDPLKSRTIVSREDRERLGLNERTWTGVVHPNVAQAFDRLKIQPEDPIERFKFNSRQRFKGSIYVQVLLKHTVVGQPDSEENKAAIAAVQKRVLNSLMADEFHLMQELRESPGMIGYATREAIAKLTANPDVVGVCLDDRPVSEPLPILTKDKLPPRSPGEYANEPGVVGGKAGADVYQALDLYGRVSVLVLLEPEGDPLPKLTHVRSETQSRWEAREIAVRELQDRVLSTLTADDFRLSTRLGGSPGFGGFVNREGVRKLLANPEVKGMEIENLIKLDPNETRRP